MPRKKKTSPIPILHIPKNATMKQIYACAKEQFTAADLQRYTEIEPMIPGKQLLAELEAIHERESKKLERKKNKKK